MFVFSVLDVYFIFLTLKAISCTCLNTWVRVKTLKGMLFSSTSNHTSATVNGLYFKYYKKNVDDSVLSA